MSQLREISSAALAIIIGALLYVVLSWVPVFGPLIVGIAAGRIAKGPILRGLLVGASSAIAGFMLLSIYAPSGLSGNFLIILIIIPLTLTGIIFAGIGGIFGSLMVATTDFLSSRQFRKPPESAEWEPNTAETSDLFDGHKKEHYKSDTTTYPHTPDAVLKTLIICPNCGLGNPEEYMYCTSCKMKLR